MEKQNQEQEKKLRSDDQRHCEEHSDEAIQHKIQHTSFAGSPRGACPGPRSGARDDGFAAQGRDDNGSKHEWDGITELKNPDPFWLRLLFYAALFFALIYWILYPSWPTPDSHGLLGWSSVEQLQEQEKEIQAIRDKYQVEFDKANFAEIMASPTLLKFALAGGQSAFANNCAVCHGAGGTGAPGYPNLTDDKWLWGGTIDEIYTTIKYGVRSGDPECHDSQMPSFGADKILSPSEIETLVDFVLTLSSTGKIEPGKGNDLFQANCSACHGDNGQGSKDFGAPALNNQIWLYGGDRDTLYKTIYFARSGVMPYWHGKLSDSTIRELAIYVHELGGGE